MNAQETLEDMEWLARLAHRLVRDPALADDAVQDAWLAAKSRLAARGELAAPDRGLLARTLRGMILHARRGARRRTFHESQAARGEALPSVEELLEIGERQQELWRHLAALEEPFRKTLLLRFQQSLSTRELAERLGVKEDTVRWRTRRGLELLRDSLEREEGGAGLLGLVPVAGLAVHGSTSAVGAAGAAAAGGASWLTQAGAFWIMNKTTFALMIGAAAVLAGIFLARTGAELPAPKIAAGPAAVGGDALEEISELTRQPASAERRDAPGALVVAEQALEAGGPLAIPVEECFLFGRMVDREGRPLDGMTLTLQAGGDWQRDAETNADGSFEFACPVEHGAKADLTASPQGFYGSVLVRMGQRISADFPPLTVASINLGDIVVKPAGVVRGRVVDDAGVPVAGASVGLNQGYSKAETDAAGAFVLRGAPLGGSYVRIYAEGFLRESRPIETEPGVVLDCGTIVLRPLDIVRVTGVVVDTAGEPVAGARVASSGDSVEVGADGAFTFDFRGKEGQVFLNASAEGYRVAETQLCSDGASIRLVLHTAGPLHRFLVLDRDTRTPIAGAEVRLDLHPDRPLEERLYTGWRHAHVPQSGGGLEGAATSDDSGSGADGRLDGHGESGKDIILVTAPGYRKRDVELRPFDGGLEEILLTKLPRADVEGVIPEEVYAMGVRIAEVQILERLSGETTPNGDLSVDWLSPPETMATQAALNEWVAEVPTLRVKGRSLVHVDAQRRFDCSYVGRALGRAVLRLEDGRVALSEPFLLSAAEPANASEWSLVSLGSLQGHARLPHADLAPELRFQMAGSRQDEMPVDSLGNFGTAELIPGSYLLMSTAQPDGVPLEALRQVVEIQSSVTTHVELDLGLPPYAEVEVTLLVNGKRPPEGFGIHFQKGDEDFYDYYDYEEGEAIRHLVPAGDGYRVIVEPLDGSGDNAYFQVAGLVDVPAGHSRLDLEIEACTVVCSIGERHYGELKGAWQLLVVDGPDGASRVPIDAAQHVVFNRRPSADDNYVDVTFRCVPLDAAHLRFRLVDRMNEQIRREIPFEAELRAGATVRVVLD